MDENWGYPYVRKPPYDEMGCDNYILPETNEHVKLEEKTPSSFVFWKGPDKCSSIFIYYIIVGELVWLLGWLRIQLLNWESKQQTWGVSIVGYNEICYCYSNHQNSDLTNEYHALMDNMMG